MKEHDEQANLFQWAVAMTGIYPELSLLFAIPNAGKRSIGAAMYYRAEGLKSGVPDMCLPVARGGYHGMFLELKAGKNKPTEEQKAWIDELAKQGYYACVAWGFDEARQKLTEYLEMG